MIDGFCLGFLQGVTCRESQPYLVKTLRLRGLIILEAMGSAS